MKSLTIILLILLIRVTNVLHAQQTTAKVISADSIPSIEVLLDSAMKYSPALKMYDMQIEQDKNQLLLLKYNWMKEIFLVMDSKYGMYGNNQPGDQMSLGYGAGAVIKLPLSAFAGNKERKKIAKAQLNESIYNKEILISELKKTIIKQYNETIFKRNVLKIKAKSYESAEINWKLSEQEFKNGIIHIDQYSRISEIYYSQLELLEESKMELKTSFAILMEMSGINSLQL